MQINNLFKWVLLILGIVIQVHMTLDTQGFFHMNPIVLGLMALSSIQGNRMILDIILPNILFLTVQCLITFYMYKSFFINKEEKINKYYMWFFAYTICVVLVSIVESTLWIHYEEILDTINGLPISERYFKHYHYMQAFRMVCEHFVLQLVFVSICASYHHIQRKVSGKQRSVLKEKEL